LKSALGASQIRLVPANAAHEIDDAGH
jgi:hypothetical protein